MSSFVMQTIADFLVRAMRADSIITHMYLDDIIMISPTSYTATRDYQKVLKFLEELGLEVATNKLQPPAQEVTWLGIRVDIPANQLSIPQAKLGQIRDCMVAASRRPYLVKKHLQRLIGLANHLAKIVRAARIFICRILAALRAATSDTIRVTHHVKADLAWFARHLVASNGRAIIPTCRIVKRIWADACLRGAGASDGAVYYEHVFTEEFADAHHIVHLEALNCLAAVRTFVGPDSAGGTIEVMCDNQPGVDALTSGRARDQVLAACARAMWFHAAQNDVDLRFTHVPGEGMALPDALSRVAINQACRDRADHLIRRLGITPVSVDWRAFSYKSFF